MVDEKKSLQDRATDKTIEDISGSIYIVGSKTLKLIKTIVDYSGGIGRRFYEHKRKASVLSALVGSGEGGILYPWVIEYFLYEPYEEPTLPIGKIGAILVAGLRLGHTLYEVNKTKFREEEQKLPLQ